MDFLMAMLSPTLSKVLEVCFLTGYVTAYRLEAARKLRGGVPHLPRLSSRTRPARTFSTGSTGKTPTKASTKSLPNDPQRQGNIWHRYEQLENATKSLSNVNQQLVEERARHKKEKKRLEDAIMELRLQNEQLGGGGGGALADEARPRSATTQTSPLSEESKALMRELDTPEDSRHLARELTEAKQEVQRLTEEVSDAHNQLEFLRSQNQALEADNTALQRRGGGGGAEVAARRRPSLGGAAASPFTAGGPAVGSFAEEVASVAAAKLGMNPQASQLASFGSDIEAPQPSEGSRSQQDNFGTTDSSELDRAAAASAAATTDTAQIEALTRENRLLQERVAAFKAAAAAAGAVGGGVFVGHSAQLKQLQEQNKRLTEENQRLQNKILRVDQEPVRVQELEDNYNKLLEENTRLQSKVVRLNLGAPQNSAGDNALVEELREENAELREDNDKLVAYLESLERKKKDLEEFAAQAQGGGVSAAGELGQFVQLKSDNRRLMEENEKLKKQLDDAALASGGSYTTVPIPVRVETGEEMDKDLWMLVEELRDQNRHLIEEMTAAKSKGTLSGAAADQATEAAVDESGKLEELQRQLAAVMESKAAEINDDNIRLVNHLSEENSALQQENMRLTKKLAAGGALADGEVLRETISSNERLLGEKQKVDMEWRRVAEKNTRLIYENEALLKQLASPENTLKPTDSFRSTGAAPPAAQQQQKGLFGKFSKGFRRRTSKDLKVEEEDLQPSSTETSISSAAGPHLKDGPGAPRQLIQELIEENSKLFEENKKLGASTLSIKELADANQKLQEENQKLQSGMGLVKELTDENTKLVDENKHLADSVNRCLEENRELTNRLINIAFQNEDDIFDAAFGEGPGGGTKADRVAAPPPFDTSQVQRRQKEIAEQMRLAEEQQKRDEVRREELSARASDQLEAYEQARVSSAAAYKKSAANAMARLSTLSQKALKTSASRSSEGDTLLLSNTPESMPVDNSEGTFDEAFRRRKQADLARAELNKKIEASRRRREGGPEAATNPSASRKELEQRQAQADLQQQAEEKVRKAFYRFAGNDDLGSFMRVLGYPGFESTSVAPGDEGQLIDIFQQAMSTTSDQQLDPTKSAEDKAVAVATQKYLQDWYAQFTSG